MRPRRPPGHGRTDVRVSLWPVLAAPAHHRFDTLGTLDAQRSLDDLGRPIRDVTFCVVDVETTGGSATDGAITEVGAVRIRGGVCEGTFSTLVDPGRPIPREITALTGISAETVADAPPFRSVVDDIADFVGDAVIVGHNIRYDIGFLAAEFERAGRPRLGNRSVCTLALARRLVRDEVPDCRLGTLAACLRLDHRPSHRALDDALATTDLFNALLERAGTYGVLGLEDLLVLPRIAGHPQAAKLRLTESLPRTPGVYRFCDRVGNVLYVGKATDLRSRVRSYFSTDDRRKVNDLLRSTHTIDHEVSVHPLAAAVREVQLIAEHLPRYNSQATRWRSMTYVVLTDEAFPRLKVTRTPPPPGTTYLGPLASTAAARRVIDAVTTVVPLRRCTAKVPADRFGQLDLAGIGSGRPAPCAPAQLGVACCPCSGETSPEDYARYCDRIDRGFTTDPDLLLGPLRQRLVALADQQRFEQAAELRDRAATLAAAIRRRRRLEAWRSPARVVVEYHDGSGAELVHGLLGRTWAPGRPPPEPVTTPPPPHGAVPREEAYERLCIIGELERTRSNWRLVEVRGTLAQPAAGIDLFAVDGVPERPRGH